jgi:hypothetical protein
VSKAARKKNAFFSFLLNNIHFSFEALNVYELYVCVCVCTYPHECRHIIALHLYSCSLLDWIPFSVKILSLLLPSRKAFDDVSTFEGGKCQKWSLTNGVVALRWVSGGTKSIPRQYQSSSFVSFSQFPQFIFHCMCVCCGVGLEEQWKCSRSLWWKFNSICWFCYEKFKI